MSEEPIIEKLKMHTPDFADANVQKLAQLFPSCVTEVKDQTGNLKRTLDFDLLRQELSGVIVEGPQERYRIDWPGKREALAISNAPITKTLRPSRDNSVEFDTTQNLYLEGDNLEGLKMLQENYLGKVQMIYIDPPYNTGNDFLYDDDFRENTEEYFEQSNQKNSSGSQLKSNLESDGRFHSNWLTMMYPRLKCARNLLADDGVFFVSIDDGEVSNLRRILDEIFGERNFIASLCWQKRYVSNVTAKWLSDMHDHVLVYARNAESLRFRDWDRTPEQLQAYKNPDNDPRGVWRAQDLSASKPYSAGQFEITGPKEGKFLPPPNRYWRCNQQQFEKWRDDNRIWWGVNQDARPMLKSFLSEVTGGIKPNTWWGYEFAGHNKEATLDLKKLFDGDAPFDTPKPTKLIRRMIELLVPEDGIILDFFSGSGTTAHAVLETNAKRGSRYKFIMTQLPEKVEKGDFDSISDIGQDRIKRAGMRLRNLLNKELEGKLPGSDEHAELLKKLKNLDTGFRVLKVDSSNMADVYYRPDEVGQQDLFEHIDNIKPDRTHEDLLFQVLLDWGLELSLPIESEKINKQSVFFVDGNALAACFETKISEDLVREIAKRKPLRVVFRDSGFADDSTKINVVQIFKQLSPGTEVRSI